jgi:amino-acid N-acetyltransferase
MQALIMEILHAHPSLRDSKTYLKAFGATKGATLPPGKNAAKDTNTAKTADNAVTLGPLHLPMHDPAAQAATVPHEEATTQQHTALVKVQGPFSPRQMESIAEGMVYLQRLGLVAVIVLDLEDRAGSTFRFAADGAIQGDDLDLFPSLPRSQIIGKLQEATRREFTSFATKLAELLRRRGAPARPMTHAVMRVESTPNPASGRSPLTTDDKLSSIRRALESDMIPILTPTALYTDSDGALRSVCVPSNDVMVALAREMADAKNTDLTPLRLMVINREGGIPSHARGGNPHLSINLASEYSHIKNTFVWDETNPTALDNLDMVRDCLAYMPQTSSGVVVSHRSPKSLIANLITNKAAHSPSLPHRLLAGRDDVRHTPTIIRPGLPIKVLPFDQLNTAKMTDLLQTSFRRTLDAEAYYGRLKRSLDFFIVLGDYEGAAIVTKEDGNIAYLDKFAVLPTLQGSGAVDFLWTALRDEVHGLGLLDALNDNGGLGGFGAGRDLVWKSRASNPVNRWYYERSNGFARIGPDWTLFWADAEDRLAAMSGERRLSAGASLQEILESAKEQPKRFSAIPIERPEVPILPIVAPSEDGRLARWAQCVSSIPSAWVPV